MTRKKQRLFFLLLGGVTLLFAGILAAAALQEGMIYYYTPSEVYEKPPGTERHLRIGGMVEAGTLVREGDVAHFVITDNKARLPTIYKGVLPTLFREEDGVVAEGNMDSEGRFVASLIMAKHDENYMPREVSDALENKAAPNGSEEKAE